MRVAILGDYPCDKDRLAGGVEAATWRLADAISRVDGMEVHAITLTTNVSAPRTQRHGTISEHFLPEKGTLARLSFHLLNRMQVRGVIRQIRPDIVHAHGSVRYPLCGEGLNCPLIITPHGMLAKEGRLETGIPSRLRLLIDTVYERRVCRHASDVILLSDYVTQFVRPYTNARTYSIANAISEEYFRVSEPEIPGTVLFVGVITPRKGLGFLLEGMKELRGRGFPCRLLVVGKDKDAEYASSLREFIRTGGLADRVEWIGPVSEDVLRRLYGQCSVLALTSVEETLPTVISQAMAAGRAVIGTRSAGIPYMVHHGETGLLVEQGDTVGLANSIELILSDHERRNQMGRAARAIAERRYASEGVAAAHVAAYKSAQAHWHGKIWL